MQVTKGEFLAPLPITSNGKMKLGENLMDLGFALKYLEQQRQETIINRHARIGDTVLDTMINSLKEELNVGQGNTTHEEMEALDEVVEEVTEDDFIEDPDLPPDDFEIDDDDLVEQAMEQGLAPSLGDKLAGFKNEGKATNEKEDDTEETEQPEEETEILNETEGSGESDQEDSGVGEETPTEEEDFVGEEDKVGEDPGSEGEPEIPADPELDDVKETQLEKDIKRDTDIEKEEEATVEEPQPQLEGVDYSDKQINAELVPMDLEDYQALSAEVNDLNRQLYEYTLQMTSIKDKAKGVSGELSDKMKTLASKTVTKSIPTWWKFDWDNDLKTYQAEYQGEIIDLKTVKIEQYDRQTTLSMLARKTREEKALKAKEEKAAVKE